MHCQQEEESALESLYIHSQLKEASLDELSFSPFRMCCSMKGSSFHAQDSVSSQAGTRMETVSWNAAANISLGLLAALYQERWFMRDSL